MTPYALPLNLFSFATNKILVIPLVSDAHGRYNDVLSHEGKVARDYAYFIKIQRSQMQS